MHSHPKVVFMFGGQGSQYHGMGAELMRTSPSFRQWMERGDSAFRGATGQSLLDEIHRKDRSRADAFSALQFTHPALLVVQHALAELFSEAGIRPDLCLGYSLGELVAAPTCGVSRFENVLAAIVHQAQLVEQYCPRGRMLAVLQTVSCLEREPMLFAEAECAARNFDQHFAVSGPPNAVRRIQTLLEARGTTCVPLPVEYAFHSRYVDALASFEEELEIPMGWGPATCPLLSCATTEAVADFDGAHMFRALRASIRFATTVQKLRAAHRELVFVDLSPSGTLATFVSRLAPHIARTHVMRVMSPFGNEVAALARAIDRVRALTHRGEPTLARA